MMRRVVKCISWIDGTGFFRIEVFFATICLIAFSRIFVLATWIRITATHVSEVSLRFGTVALARCYRTPCWTWFLDTWKLDDCVFFRLQCCGVIQPDRYV